MYLMVLLSYLSWFVIFFYNLFDMRLTIHIVDVLSVKV